MGDRFGLPPWRGRLSGDGFAFPPGRERCSGDQMCVLCGGMAFRATDLCSRCGGGGFGRLKCVGAMGDSALLGRNLVDVLGAALGMGFRITDGFASTSNLSDGPGKVTHFDSVRAFHPSPAPLRGCLFRLHRSPTFFRAASKRQEPRRVGSGTTLFTCGLSGSPFVVL